MNEFWRRELHLVLLVGLVLLGVGAGFLIATLLYAGEVQDLTNRVNAAVSRHCVWWDPKAVRP